MTNPKTMTSCMSKCMKVSEGMEDRISNLPSEIIDCILDYMPVRDAARTSILSRKWRNFWPMHTKLIFDEHYFKVIRNARLQFHKIINKILLQHMGPIVEFFLDLSYISAAQYSIVDQWMFFLSRNGVKKLSLMYSKQTHHPYRLISYVFSCPSLKHLALHNVMIKPCSSGSLGNLTSLSCNNIFYESNASVVSLRDSLNPNLKELNFSLCKELAKKHGFDLSSLLEKLPKIGILLLDGFALKFLAAGTAPTLLPRTVECLEHLTLDGLDITDLDQISTVVCLLRSCPNLRILDLKVLSRIKVNGGEGVLNYLKALDCTKLNLVKLETVKICLNKKPVAELMLLKVLLGCSPSLGKFIIEVKCSIDSVVGFRITKELLGFSRASPNANIIWSQCKNSKTCHFRRR